jgi:hypothetical protein
LDLLNKETIHVEEKKTLFSFFLSKYVFDETWGEGGGHLHWRYWLQCRQVKTLKLATVLCCSSSGLDSQASLEFVGL